MSQGAGIGGAVEKSQGGDIRITGGVVLIDNNGFGAGIGGGGSEKKPSTAGNGGKDRVCTLFAHLLYCGYEKPYRHFLNLIRFIISFRSRLVKRK